MDGFPPRVQDEMGAQFIQRFEHKFALDHAWVWQIESVGGCDLVAEEQQVQVNGARFVRGVGTRVALPTQFQFDFKENLQYLLRIGGIRPFEEQNLVQKCRSAVGHSPCRSFINTRFLKGMFPLRFEQLCGSFEQAVAFALIASDANGA